MPRLSGKRLTDAVAWVQAMQSDGFVFEAGRSCPGLNDFAIRKAGAGRDDTASFLDLLCGSGGFVKGAA